MVTEQNVHFINFETIKVKIDSRSWEVEMGRRKGGNDKDTALLILQNGISRDTV